MLDGAVKSQLQWEKDGPPMKDRTMARTVVERSVQKKKLTEPLAHGANAVPVNMAAMKKRKSAQAKNDGNSNNEVTAKQPRI